MKGNCDPTDRNNMFMVTYHCKECLTEQKSEPRLLVRRLTLLFYFVDPNESVLQIGQIDHYILLSFVAKWH